MTEQDPAADGPSIRQISVAELLAKNGTAAASATRRRRPRRGDSDAITVAELTGEIPIIRVADYDEAASAPRLRDTTEAAPSGAERMSPDPVEPYGAAAALAQPENPTETTFDEDLEGAEEHFVGAASRRRWAEMLPILWRGSVIVLQSIVAVAFGAGLFIAFDQLWRWNNIVALLLSVLAILGLVVGVRIVRRTEDIASTLIAVAVGALITLGPLALLQSG